MNSLEKQASIFGNPVRIVTDRGRVFTSQAFEDYCNENKIQHLLIATGVPRGQVERMNRLLVPMLAKYCHDKPQKKYDSFAI